MASSIADTAKDLGRKVIDRAETVVGRDWEHAKRGVERQVKSDRAMYRYYTGSSDSKKARKPDPRKYPKSRTASR